MNINVGLYNSQRKQTDKQIYERNLIVVAVKAR